MRTLAEWKAHFIKLGLSEEHSTTAAKDSFDAVEAENKIGKDAYKSKDAETLAIKNTLKEAGYDKDKHGSREAFLKSLNDAAKLAADKADSDKTELQRAMDSNQKLSDRLDKQDSDARIKTEAVNKATITAKLSGSLSGKIGSHDAHIKAIIADNLLKVNDAGEVVLAAGGDDSTFDTFAKGYLETNKAALIVKQVPGSGLGGGNGDLGGGGETLDMSSFKDMSVEDASANIADIRETLGMKK